MPFNFLFIGAGSMCCGSGLILSFSSEERRRTAFSSPSSPSSPSPPSPPLSLSPSSSVSDSPSLLPSDDAANSCSKRLISSSKSTSFLSSAKLTDFGFCGASASFILARRILSANGISVSASASTSCFSSLPSSFSAPLDCFAASFTATLRPYRFPSFTITPSFARVLSNVLSFSLSTLARCCTACNRSLTFRGLPFSSALITSITARRSCLDFLPIVETQSVVWIVQYPRCSYSECGDFSCPCAGSGSLSSF
mmetsp:Transcript_21848/g.60855  ORF Transcript_21848/g.60855 Transcript_21848/m.60855 type:complete len:253 (+) Transcript_21848:720-1478(+)